MWDIYISFCRLIAIFYYDAIVYSNIMGNAFSKSRCKTKSLKSHKTQS